MSRIYQLSPVYTRAGDEIYPLPPDRQPADVMIISVGDTVFYRVVDGSEASEPVTCYRRPGVDRDDAGAWLHVVAPPGWVPAPTVDGEQPLADQGFR